MGIFPQLFLGVLENCSCSFPTTYDQNFRGVFSILNFLWIFYSWGGGGVYYAFGGLTRHVWKSYEMSSAEGYKRRSHNGKITDYRRTWWSRLIDLRVEIRLQGRVRRRYCRYRRRPRRRRRRRRRRFKGIWIRRGMSCPMTRFELKSANL